MTSQPELEQKASASDREQAAPFHVRQPDSSGQNLTIKQASEQFAVSERTLRRRLEENKIPGAHRTPGPKGEQWQIPVASLMVLGYRRVEQEPERSAAAPAEAETVKGLLALIDDLRAERKELTAGRDTLAERTQALEVELAITKERLTAAEAAADVERERREQAEALAASPKKRWWQRAT